MSIEIIERAIARLEELKGDAVKLPWSSTDQSPSMDGRNWVIRTEGEAGIKMNGHDYGYRNNVELIVALSRTVDPTLVLLKDALRAFSEPDPVMGRFAAGIYHYHVELARAVLGEVPGE